jgi:PadR family transcriptional regulator, regulatory protein PadR
MAPPRRRHLSLSSKESVILGLLIRDGELYGLELVAASRRRLKRGTVYVTLGRMEEKGYVSSRLDEAPSPGGGLPRRLYQPTALGRRVVELFMNPEAVLLPEPAR